MWVNFPLIEQAHRRLSKVIIENKDFEKLIRQYDRPVSFFYLDPPYYETEKYYKNVGEDGFRKEDHIRLRDTLMTIEGKFCCPTMTVLLSESYMMILVFILKAIAVSIILNSDMIMVLSFLKYWWQIMI